MADSTTQSQELEKLKADMKAVREDVSKLTSSLAGEAQHRAQAGAQSMRDAAGTAQQELNAASENLQGQIAARPYASVFTAFGAGLLLGVMLDRR